MRFFKIQIPSAFKSLNFAQVGLKYFLNSLVAI